MKASSKLIKAALAVSTALLLAACGSSKISADGSANSLSWPKPSASTFSKRLGTFPDPSSLAQVKAGVTKDQLYYLLGRPHYNEGFIGVREWNYLFHFHTPGQGTNNVTTCQFKVLFDSSMVGQSFYWNPVDPAGATCPPGNAPAAAPTTQRYTLSGDALFAFDKYGEGDILSGGRAELDQLAQKLRGFDRLNRVVVIGHTDYLGSDSYNLQLSQRRAVTIAQYLVNRGIPANLIEPRGMGESQPVKQCDEKLGRQQLIACLQPNRRVEIEVDGSGVLR